VRPMALDSFLYEQFKSIYWAMTEDALNAMRAVFSAGSLNADDYKLFHSLSEQNRSALAQSFGDPVKGSHYATVLNNVGFLHINGPAIPRATMFSGASGQVSLDRLTDEYKELSAMRSIDTLALMVDSPGGDVTGTSDFAALIRQTDKKVVSFNWCAASALYWISSAADEMYAPPTGVVGSVGVILKLRDSTAAMDKKGIKEHTVYSTLSPLKNSGMVTEEGKNSYQRIADDLMDVFLNDVASQRSLAKNEVAERFGQGSLVVAERALEAGMIDEITDVESFINKITSKSVASYGNMIRTTEVQTMTTVKEPTVLTSDEIKKQYPSVVEAIEQTAYAKGVAYEHDRVKAIEKLEAEFSSAMPSVRETVHKTIQKEKWSADATKSSVAELLLPVVAKAQVGAFEEHAGGRREAVVIAEHVSQATGAVDTDVTAKEAAIAKQCAGMSAAFKSEVH